MKLRAAALLLALALLLVASGALGEAARPNPARLDYDRGDLTACPQESYFRVFVAGRLGGRDPFTAEAARRIKLTLRQRQRPRMFAAEVSMYDQAGARLGGDELSEPDCTAVVEGAGLLVVSWIVPLNVPAPARAQPQERAEPAPPPLPPPAPLAPVEAKPEAQKHPAPTPPAANPKPGAFEGKAGVARAALFGLTAGGVAMGGAFVLATDNKGNGAREVGQAIQAKEGPSACMTPRSGDCQEIAQLAQQHDTFRQLAVGSFVAAGVVGAVATASIWLLRTPAAPAVQVQPSAGRTGGGLALQTYLGEATLARIDAAARRRDITPEQFLAQLVDRGLEEEEARMRALLGVVLHEHDDDRAPASDVRTRGQAHRPRRPTTRSAMDWDEHDHVFERKREAMASEDLRIGSPSERGGWEEKPEPE